MHWQTSRFLIELSRPQVMGVVNVTPDSFSDGGQFASPASAKAHCEQLLKDGADILDIGGESTRPGAQPLGESEELSRVLPVVRHAVTLGVPVSVDTYKPQVMQAVLDAGADIINDVWALRWRVSPDTPHSSDVIRAHPTCGVCLMHMHLEPQTMQLKPMQGHIVPQVLSFLERLAHDLQGLGVEKNRICLDPGIGFGKTVAQNFSLLAHQRAFVSATYPVLAGWSRKSSLAAVAELAADGQVQERMVPSVVAAVLAAERGAHILRVHDVRETVKGLRVLAAMQAEQQSE
jgi:dihydropteroate synthase